MTEKPRVWVDFMKTDGRRRILLAATGTANDLSRFGIHLVRGMKLNVYSDDADDTNVRDDLLGEGTVEYDSQAARWVLDLDWDRVRHQSDKTNHPS